MAGWLGELIDAFLHRRALRFWQRKADGAEALNLHDLHDLRGHARALRRRLDRVIHTAEYRLALPVIGSNALRKPAGSDWLWRPALWRGEIPVPGMASVPGKAAVCDGATIFHDCQRSELTARQIRNGREDDLAAFGLRLDVFRFDGSYLSLALDLPEAATAGLKLRHVIRMDAVIETEKPLELFARLNIRHGPNLEQMVREVPLGAAVGQAEFDLSYTKVVEARVERMWVDLIFEGPEMNQIILRDVTFSRHPRAEL